MQEIHGLVVDDDIPTVDVICKSVQWEKYGITKVERAYNSKQAQKILLTLPIEIAICDIEMPMGSGLELIAWARENKLETEFIFLTCHENFDFAKTAIHYGAAGYVVKPFSPESLDVELSKTVMKIQQKRQLQEHSSEEDVEENFWRKVYFHQIGSPLLAGELEKRHLKIQLKDRFQIVFFRIQMDTETTAFTETDRGIQEYAFSQLVSEILLNSFQHNRIFTFGQGTTFSAVAISEPFQDQNELYFRCEKIRDLYQRYFHGTSTAYIGRPCAIGDIAQEGHTLESLDRKNVANRGQVLFEKQIPSGGEKKLSSLDQEKLFQWMEKGGKKETFVYLKEHLEKIKRLGQLDREVLQKVQQELIQIVYTFLGQKKLQANSLFADEESITLRDNALQSLYDMIKWQNSLIGKAMDAAEEIETNKTMIQRAVDFINAHYCEDITRKEVAASIFLTPEYLAKLFKKEMGVTVKDYINSRRIEKAKTLLLQKQSKVSEVAAQVGLDNFSYFSTIFKKFTGMTPVEFKNSKNPSF